MALRLVTFMVLRIPCKKYMPEIYPIGRGFGEEKIKQILLRDKNVLRLYKFA